MPLIRPPLVLPAPCLLPPPPRVACNLPPACLPAACLQIFDSRAAFRRLTNELEEVFKAQDFNMVRAGGGRPLWVCFSVIWGRLL